MRALLLLVVLAAPTAAACSWAVPPPLTPLAWLDDGRLVGARWTEWFDVTAEPRFLAGDGAALSPDLRHAAAMQVGPPPPWQTWSDSCGGADPRYPAGADLENGTFRLLSRERVWGAVGTHAHAVYRTEDGLAYYSWGAWTRERDVRLPLPSPDFAPTSFLLSADGARLMHRGQSEWVVYDVSGPRAVELARLPEPGAPMVLSPDGRHVLSLERVADGADATRLVVRATDDLSQRASVELGAARWPERLEWGGGGIAFVATDWTEGTPVAEVRVFTPDLEPSAPLRRFEGAEAGGVAWSPEGDQLAVSLGRAGADVATLVVLDRSLATLSERNVTLATTEGLRWQEEMDRQAPAPAWDAEQVAREVPALPLVLVLALALAVAIARRR